MHGKKVKGDNALAQAIARMTELEWVVGVLLTEHAKYDFLAEKNGRVLRVQARYAAPSKAYKGKVLSVKLRTSWADKHGNHSRPRQRGDFDLLAAYCPETRKVYFVTDEQLGDRSSAFNLVLEPTYARKDMHLASNYEEFE